MDTFAAEIGHGLSEALADDLCAYSSITTPLFLHGSVFNLIPASPSRRSGLTFEMRKKHPERREWYGHLTGSAALPNLFLWKTRA
jgi:hypothetical protein